MIPDSPILVTVVTVWETMSLLSHSILMVLGLLSLFLAVQVTGSICSALAGADTGHSLDGVAWQPVMHTNVRLVDDILLRQLKFFPTESPYSYIFQMSLGQRADIFFLLS